MPRRWEALFLVGIQASETQILFVNTGLQLALCLRDVFLLSGWKQSAVITPCTCFFLARSLSVVSVQSIIFPKTIIPSSIRLRQADLHVCQGGNCCYAGFLGVGLESCGAKNFSNLLVQLRVVSE